MGSYTSDVSWRPPFAATADVPRVLAEWEAGATIVLQALHVNWHPLAVFCRLLEEALGHGVQANAYYTPRGSQGFGVHHDTHDVLVLQVAGEKRWRLYDPLLELPLKHQRYSSGLGEHGPPIDELELRAGRHALPPARLAPRGGDVRERLAAPDDRDHRVHVARRGEGRPRRLRGRARVPARCRQRRGCVRARGAPGGETRPRGDRAQTPAEVPRLAAADPRGRPLSAPCARGVERGVARRAARDGHRRPRAGGGRRRARLRGKSIRFPAHAAAEVEACFEREEPIRVSELPGGLDLDGRLVLVRRLVREGFLRVSG